MTMEHATEIVRGTSSAAWVQPGTVCTVEHAREGTTATGELSRRCIISVLPQSFIEALTDFDEGRIVDLDAALSQPFTR